MYTTFLYTHTFAFMYRIQIMLRGFIPTKYNSIILVYATEHNIYFYPVIQFVWYCCSNMYSTFNSGPVKVFLYIYTRTLDG